VPTTPYSPGGGSTAHSVLTSHDVQQVTLELRPQQETRTKGASTASRTEKAAIKAASQSRLATLLARVRRSGATAAASKVATTTREGSRVRRLGAAEAANGKKKKKKKEKEREKEDALHGSRTAAAQAATQIARVVRIARRSAAATTRRQGCVAGTRPPPPSVRPGVKRKATMVDDTPGEGFVFVFVNPARRVGARGATLLASAGWHQQLCDSAVPSATWSQALAGTPPAVPPVPPASASAHLVAGVAQEEEGIEEATEEAGRVDATPPETSASLALDGQSMEVEKKQEHTPGPYPLTVAEIGEGWALINKCWLPCAECECWRNVPMAVRNTVVATSGRWTCGMATGWRDVRNPRRPAAACAERRAVCERSLKKDSIENLLISAESCCGVCVVYFSGRML
jgi:hypothetical protein